MKLHYTRPSPYARKTIVVAHELRLIEQVELVEITVPTIPTNPNPELARENPLVKVPVLVLDSGERLLDSIVIAEYLDSLSPGPRVFPASGSARWRALKLHALADGIMDAGVLVRLEGLRPEQHRWPTWVTAQHGKVLGALDYIESDPAILEGEFHIGHIALVCALEWIVFRDVHRDWPIGHPRLAAWYEQIRDRPSLIATRPE
jgi:glutathione S-transferase